MKTDVSVTSILAYHDIELGAKQLEVLRALQHLETIGKPTSCEGVCEYLGYTPNRVTGRIKELLKKGAIEHHGFAKSKFNKDVQCYRLISKGQNSLI